MLDYFDLYLTPGPKFTSFFEKLNQKREDFSVVETGWTKLDTLFNIVDDDIISWEREKLLAQYNVKYIVLYAPSSDEKLTSARVLKDAIVKLSSQKEVLFLVHFEEGMPEDIVEQYREIKTKNIRILDERNISKNMHISNLLISDTTSYVYEFILLDKPVITVDTKLIDITWTNLSPSGLYLNVIRTLENRVATRNRRDQTIKNYHPYRDGKSSKRVVEASMGYLKEHKVPQERKLSILKKWKFKRAFNKY
jgi:CDP-glycerol glycerophosphotransferase (TagB/SpsB family)